MRELGNLGENLAAEYYIARGYKVVERNYIYRHGRQVGEIVLIVLRGNELVFVEVKLRHSNKFGNAFESVNRSKQIKLVKTAKLFLLANPKFQNYQIRIDVAAIDIDNRQEPVIILTNAIDDSD